MNLTEKIFNWIPTLLSKIGLSGNLLSYIGLFLNTILLILLTYLIYWIFKFLLVTVMAIVAKKTKTKFDNLLINSKTAKYISHLIPLLLIHNAVPIIFKDFEYWETIFAKMIGVYIVFLVLWITRTVLNALKNYLNQKPRLADKPFESYIEVIMFFLWLLGIVYIVLFLFNTSAQGLLTTLGAISALIILIFRDTILNLVASIQVSVNDMIRVGDWITMDKFGADGEVVEINLATVKVRNFDFTTTTIPTYSLLSDSFKNWRSMTLSGGRLIKKHLLISSQSVTFLNSQELESLKNIQLISSYIEQKQLEIKKYNLIHNVDKSYAINGRNLTNLGLFRKYITNYLNQHPGLNKEMKIICRQLQSTPQGIPLEIYAFSADKRFENYEYILADIFDHFYASAVYFDLELFESPSKIQRNKTNS
ncbi:MAG: mechanosensitive ion channel family protein [Flavobacterium sp.]